MPFKVREILKIWLRQSNSVHFIDTALGLSNNGNIFHTAQIHYNCSDRFWRHRLLVIMVIRKDQGQVGKISNKLLSFPRMILLSVLCCFQQTTISSYDGTSPLWKCLFLFPGKVQNLHAWSRVDDPKPVVNCWILLYRAEGLFLILIRTCFSNERICRINGDVKNQNLRVLVLSLQMGSARTFWPAQSLWHVLSYQEERAIGP